MTPVEMSEEALLEQLIEESGELIQVAAKRLRILRGESPTPVTLEKNMTALIEEMADVECCTSVYETKMHIRNSITHSYFDKMDRWNMRLNNQENRK